MSQMKHFTKDIDMTRRVLQKGKMNYLVTIPAKESIYNYLSNKCRGIPAERREIRFSEIRQFLNDYIRKGTYIAEDILAELIEVYSGDDFEILDKETAFFESGFKRQLLAQLLLDEQITGFVFQGVEFISDEDDSSEASR
ncbi:hypothetical protein Bhyg_05236, partial [Pseudolycoriella hygida]